MATHHILSSSVFRLLNTIVSSIHSLIPCSPEKFVFELLIACLCCYIQYFNLSCHSKTIWRQWMGSSLMQVMDCCLFVANATCLSIRLRNKLWWENTQVFFLENLFEIAVCKMAAKLFRPRVCEKGGKMVANQIEFSRLTKLLCKLLPSHLTYDSEIVHCIDSIAFYEKESFIMSGTNKNLQIWNFRNIP